MRRVLRSTRVAATALLALVACARVAAAGDAYDPAASAAALFWPDGVEERAAADPPSLATEGSFDTDRDGLPRAALDVVERLSAPCVELRARVVSVAPGTAELAGFLASSRTVLTTEDAAALRAALAAGGAVGVADATACGAVDDVLRLRDLGARNAAVYSDVECAIHVATTVTHGAHLCDGLRLQARVAPHDDGAHVLAYDLAWVGVPRIAPAMPLRDVARDEAAGDACAARGALLLAPGATACLRFRSARDAQRGSADGRTLLVLLRVVARGEPRLPLDLGDGWVAVPTAALEALAPDPLPLADGGDDDERTTGPADALAPWTAPFHAPPAGWVAQVLGDAGIDVAEIVHAPRGVAFVRTRDRGAAHAAADAVLAAGRAGVVCDVSDAAGARLVLPGLDGFAVSGFVGTLRTDAVPGELNVETGCDDSIGVHQWVRPTPRGMRFVLASAPGQAAEIDVRSDVETRGAPRTLRARRSLPGHATTAWEDLVVPSRTLRDLRVRSAVPDGACELAGGLRVRVARERATATPAPVALLLGGERVCATPGRAARVRRIVTEQHATELEWDGSCGVTYRWPQVRDVPAGLDVAASPGPRGTELDVAGLVLGAPQVLDPAFDTGDGVCAIVRRPQLAVRTTLPLGALRRIAWGAGLELTAGAESAVELPPLRTLSADDGARAAGLRFAGAVELELRAGDHVALPSQVATYTSNHESGEAYVVMLDAWSGVTAGLASDGDVLRGDVTFVAAAAPRAFDVTKFQAPARPDRDVRLLLPVTSAHAFALVVPPGIAVELRALAGSAAGVRVGMPRIEEAR